MAQSITCGFAVSIVLNGPSRYPPTNRIEGIATDFQSSFSSYDNFNIYDNSTLKEKIKAYLKFIQSKKKNISGDTKKQIIKDFSTSLWSQLPVKEKCQHSLKDCQVSSIAWVHQYT